MFLLFSKAYTLGFSLQNRDFRTDAVVALDSSGYFMSVINDVHAAPDLNQERLVIYAKAEIYNERVFFE